MARKHLAMVTCRMLLVFTASVALVYYSSFIYFGCVIFLNFVASTWSMPQTLLSPPPYTPRVPAPSNCKTYQATDLFVVPQSSSVSFSFYLKLSFYYPVLLIITLYYRPQGQPRPLVPMALVQVTQVPGTAGGSGATSTQAQVPALHPLARSVFHQQSMRLVLE